MFCTEECDGIFTMEPTDPTLSRESNTLCSKPISTINVPIEAPIIDSSAPSRLFRFIRSHHRLRHIGNGFAITGNNFRDQSIRYLESREHRVTGLAPDDFLIEGQLADEAQRPDPQTKEKIPPHPHPSILC
jgi:hypothetical protein